MGPWSCLAEEWFGIPVPMQVVLSSFESMQYRAVVAGCVGAFCFRAAVFSERPSSSLDSTCFYSFSSFTGKRPGIAEMGSPAGELCTDVSKPRGTAIVGTKNHLAKYGFRAGVKLSPV